MADVRFGECFFRGRNGGFGARGRAGHRLEPGDRAAHACRFGLCVEHRLGAGIL